MKASTPIHADGTGLKQKSIWRWAGRWLTFWVVHGFSIQVRIDQYTNKREVNMVKWSGNTPRKIGEIELNFSNLCGAQCLFCSRNHGVGNSPFMEPETFGVLVRARSRRVRAGSARRGRGCFGGPSVRNRGRGGWSSRRTAWPRRACPDRTGP